MTSRRAGRQLTVKRQLDPRLPQRRNLVRAGHLQGEPADRARTLQIMGRRLAGGEGHALLLAAVDIACDLGPA